MGFVSHQLAKAQGIEFSQPRKEGPAPAVDIGFVTNDVESAYKKAVNAGAIEVIPPKTMPWGQVVVYVREINGFLVGINAPMQD